MTSPRRAPHDDRSTSSRWPHRLRAAWRELIALLLLVAMVATCFGGDPHGFVF